MGKVIPGPDAWLQPPPQPTKRIPRLRLETLAGGAPKVWETIGVHAQHDQHVTDALCCIRAGLRELARNGEIEIPTLGHPELERPSDFQAHWFNKALIVASQLVLRRLKGQAAVDYFCSGRSSHLLNAYEGKAALRIVEQLD